MELCSQINPETAPLRPELAGHLNLVSNHCTGCGLCVNECSFLTHYGSPKFLADNYDPTAQETHSIAFECSLCELCTATCPHNVDPARMFLEMRREAFDRRQANLPEHRGLRSYEKKGTSKLFSWYALPAGCDTIFFPGCALTGSRADTTLKTYAFLQQNIPSLGIVLDCCTKPSHDLGNTEYFTAMFGEMKNYLLKQGVRNILVACPNCHKVFTEYGEEFTTRTVYELFNESELPAPGAASAIITVHDPCVARFATAAQHAVRELLRKKGFHIEEAQHSQQRTLCCGEGGATGCLVPEHSREWTDKRVREANGHRIVSYCASCSRVFASRTRSSHALDLFFEPDLALKDKLPVANAPLTYFNRLRVKNQLRRKVPAAITRERTFRADVTSYGTIRKKLAVLILLTLAFFAVRSGGATDYLDQDKLRTLIHSYGMLAPMVYMLIYAVAPALLLPGLPIALVGGILFGPFWGVVYSITSATAGACLAFLISRYLARDLVESRLNGPRWQRLHLQVEAAGWKMVALTRLIPLFPFNLLNYAFGLTRVKFSHYALASFIFMLPGCIAFITFSSSLPDLVRGKVSPAFLLGVTLLVGVSALPVIYKRLKKTGA